MFIARDIEPYGTTLDKREIVFQLTLLGDHGAFGKDMLMKM
ncbi:hypothetical protein [Dawidia cretensis]|nr:hypothetical protein [Dawidia cretensis]